MNERSGRCCALIHGMFVCHRVVKGTSEAESFTYGFTDSVAPSFFQLVFVVLCRRRKIGSGKREKLLRRS